MCCFKSMNSIPGSRLDSRGSEYTSPHTAWGRCIQADIECYRHHNKLDLECRIILNCCHCVVQVNTGQTSCTPCQIGTNGVGKFSVRKSQCLHTFWAIFSFKLCTSIYNFQLYCSQTTFDLQPSSGLRTCDQCPPGTRQVCEFYMISRSSSKCLVTTLHHKRPYVCLTINKRHACFIEWRANTLITHTPLFLNIA